MKGSDKKKSESEGVTQKPILTCAGDWNLFCTLEATLDVAIPQDRCEWRRSYGRIAKNVFLEATFAKFTKEHLITIEDGWNLLKKPLLHVFWTDCVDLESYKTTLREEIEVWMKMLQNKDITDWLIVLVETYDFRKTNKLLPRTTVLDKIRSDFTTKQTEDRCLSVINPIKSESRSAESWRGLVARIRYLMLTAYNKTLIKFEEHIKKQKERRKEPDWNYLQYFLLQEQLAFVYESLSLYDESLIQYDELEALFMEAVSDLNARSPVPKWMDAFRRPIEKWHCVTLGPVLPVKLRERVVSATGTLLDFRSYLYQRQCAMLMLGFRPWEMLKRCTSCVRSACSEAQRLEIEIGVGGLACWALVACADTLAAVLRLLNAANAHNKTRDLVDLCTAHQAPVYHLAKDKLYDLGKLCGLLPGTPDPSSEQLHLVVMLSSSMIEEEQRSTVTRLKEALCSKAGFQSYYLELAELACGTYKHHGNMRFARLIGRELAAFYSDLGEMNKAVAFLQDALRSYEEEGWKQLAAQTRLELVACYKKMADLDRYTKLCATIACTNELEILVRHFYFDEMIKSLKSISTANEAVICDMSSCFNLLSLNAIPNERGPYVTDNTVEFRTVFDSWFPREVFCQRLAISLELEKKVTVLKPKLKSDTNSPSPRKPQTENFEEIQLIQSITEGDIKPKNIFNTTLNITSNKYLKEDGTLERTTIECRNPKALLIRSESSKFRKPSNVVRSDYTMGFSCDAFKITPGLNELTLSFTPHLEGTYKLNQISIRIESHLEYLSNVLVGKKVGFDVVTQKPGVLLNKVDAKCDLLAGIDHVMELIVLSGSKALSDNTLIKLETSKGLSLCRADNDSDDMSRELSLVIDKCDAFDSVKIPLKFYAALHHRKDEKCCDYKVWITCPWSTTSTEVNLDFSPPFSITNRLLTCETRKYLYLSVKCKQAMRCKLIEPSLRCTGGCDVSFEDMNPKIGVFHLTPEISTLSFLWELKHEPLLEETPVKLDFHFEYESEFDQKVRSHTHALEMRDYATLFIVRSKVEPCKGNEFCRASSICRLVVAVHRINETEYTSLMFEVLADQTMWTVCGRTAGVLTINNGDIEPQCVTLEVMPLMSGYLPLPTVRLSKYIVSESKDGSHPRLEPFPPGQVYHTGKAMQVHVLAPLNDT